MVFKLYSMDTFLPKAINEANRTQDGSKVTTLGPFNYLLNQMLKAVEGQKFDRIIDQNVQLYRFALLSDDDLRTMKFLNKMRVNGHLSTSRSKEYAYDCIKQRASLDQ